MKCRIVANVILFAVSMIIANHPLYAHEVSDSGNSSGIKMTNCKKWVFEKQGGFEGEPSASLSCGKGSEEIEVMSITCDENTLYLVYRPSFKEFDASLSDWAGITYSFSVQDTTEFRDFAAYMDGPGGFAIFRSGFLSRKNPFVKGLLHAEEMMIGFTDSVFFEKLPLNGVEDSLVSLSKVDCPILMQEME